MLRWPLCGIECLWPTYQKHLLAGLIARSLPYAGTVYYDYFGSATVGWYAVVAACLLSLCYPHHPHSRGYRAGRWSFMTFRPTSARVQKSYSCVMLHRDYPFLTQPAVPVGDGKIKHCITARLAESVTGPVMMAPILREHSMSSEPVTQAPVIELDCAACLPAAIVACGHRFTTEQEKGCGISGTSSLTRANRTPPALATSSSHPLTCAAAHTPSPSGV